MPAVVSIMLKEIMIPYADVHLMIGTYYARNSASKRVFEKNGFVYWKKGTQELPETKTGVKDARVGIEIMRWSRAS